MVYTRLIIPLTAAALAVASAASFGLSPLIAHFGSPESPLAEFYVMSLASTLVGTGIILLVGAVCIGLFSVTRIRERVYALASRVIIYFNTMPTWKFALWAHAIAAVVLFVLNAPGILGATFMIDDYMMYDIATSNSWWHLVWTPVNEHVIPLFWWELKALFMVTGPHPVPLNALLFIPAIFVVGGAATLMRMLKFGLTSFVVILVTFAASIIMSHQLYGFYAVGPYMQVLAVFMLSLISFVHARETGKSKFALLSYVLLVVGLLIESGAVWTPLAYVLFIYAYHMSKTGVWNPLPTLKREWLLIAGAGALLILYAVYLAVLATVATESFYGPQQFPISLGTLHELYRVFTAGTLSALFAPRFGLVMSQPRFVGLVMYWELVMAVLALVYFTVIAWAVRAGGRARVWSIYFTLIILGTALLVAIARANAHDIPFYRDQNMLFSLLFLSLALAATLSEWFKHGEGASRAARGAVIAGFLCVVFAGQYAFSFYKIQYYDDFVVNKALVDNFNQTLVPALADATAEHGPLVIPSLSPLFYTSGFQHQFRQLSEFGDFLGIQNVTWLPVDQGAYLASTSPEFIELLKKDERLRSVYLHESEVAEFCSDNSFGTDNRKVQQSTSVQLISWIDPMKTHKLFIDISAANAPEKMYINLKFKNDFGTIGTITIRIDQYTKQTKNPERRYACSVDLNQIPAFALSKQILNFSIEIPTPGTYTLRGYHFE